jgi:hypothetical protein
MPGKTMLILRGNAAGAGTYPDEQGNKIAWPNGALHVKAASDFAKRLGYDPVVIDVGGYPQSQHSPQAKAALKAFHDLDDQTVVGFYGFSGGGYNVKHILDYLAAHEPQSIRRIDRVVVLGAPNKQGGKDLYKPAGYNVIAKKKAKDPDWTDADWEVIFRENPDPSQLPNGVPKDTPTHMFGPDVLLAGWPEDPKPPQASHHTSHHKSAKQ